MMTSKEAYFTIQAQEGNSSDREKEMVSTQWIRLRDPRVVSVSNEYGVKDRHSKVCTVKGLRDRRVRLSVTTAVQLFDLQHRLGFKQPSKAIDWLLAAAKKEIYELPPLPISQLNTCFNHPAIISPSQIYTSHPINQQRFGTLLNESSRIHDWGAGSGSSSRNHAFASVEMVSEEASWTGVDDDEVRQGEVFTSLSTGTTCAIPPLGSTHDSHNFPSAMVMKPREINHYHEMLGSNSVGPSLYPMSSQSLNPFGLGDPELVHSRNRSESLQSHEDHMIFSQECDPTQNYCFTK